MSDHRRTRRRAWAAIAALLVAQGAAAKCVLQRIEIRPLTRENGPVYFGSGKGVNLRFRNFEEHAAVTAFTEPPLDVLGANGQTV
jgi:hypothetical protein